MSSGPPRIFDSQAYRQRRKRAARLDGDIFLVQDVAGHVAERLGAINRHFARGLDLHSRGAVFPTLRPFADSWVRTGFAWDRPSVIADDEFLPFADGSFDVVTSVLSLHAVNDLRARWCKYAACSNRTASLLPVCSGARRCTS